MARRWLLSLAVTIVFFGECAFADPQSTAGPKNPPELTGRTDMERAFLSLQPRPSTDTMPIEFSVGGINYRVPRNYLVTMDNWTGGPQVLVTLRVNIPDLEPLTEQTRACFGVAPLYRPLGCAPLQFAIEGTGGVSIDQAFANARKLFHSQEALAGPAGFEKYEVGPENSRLEYYRKNKNGNTTLYSCQIFDNRGNRDGICYPVVDRLSNGGTIHFFFNLGNLADIESIDASLRKLVDNFTVKTGDSK